MFAFIDAAPSPFHACVEAAGLLEAAGFTRVAETDRWPREPGRHYLIRAGALVAWSTEHEPRPGTPFRIVAAHTDSPNLRVKPRPDLIRSGWQQLGVDVYGSALLNSWLDRDLGLSGRVSVRAPSGPNTPAGAPDSVRARAGVEERLLKVDRPILRIPQLAIHLDQSLRDQGLKLNPQQHLTPIWGVGTGSGEFTRFLAEQLQVETGDLFGWELMVHDLTPSRRIGQRGEFISAPRLDNLASCYAGVRGLIAASGSLDPDAPVPVVVLFDHEEVGSVSDRGAQSTLLTVTLERIVLAAGRDREDLLRGLAGSVCLSADMAHATHPNYAERHEPAHPIRLGGGPVLKVNTNLRYATDAPGAAMFAVACEQAGVPFQRYVNRGDLPCGSTVGPLTAARLGVTTVDAGAPQLAMHAARELTGISDPAMYLAALTAFLAPG